jgi:glyoxylase-like metal-dependent hydrolase (beta-lactamase superfamily II)
MQIRPFFDARTSTLTYVAYDEGERVGAVARFLEQERLRVPYVLDTHAHADHFSAMPYFKQRFGAQTVMGAKIGEVQRVFRDLFNLGDALAVDGGQFDVLIQDGETLDVGAFEIEALHTPGHTPACMSFRIDDALFVGDTLFQPDYGTARCDFPGGSADALYNSIQRLYRDYPEATRVFTCHDYQPGGRDVAFESTLGEQRKANVQLSADTTREEFAAFRKQRDATLGMPDLILPSIQVNIRAGELPPPEDNGRSYLKIPLNAFGEK